MPYSYLHIAVCLISVLITTYSLIYMYLHDLVCEAGVELDCEIIN